VLGDLNRLDVPFKKLSRVTAISAQGVTAQETGKDGAVTEAFYPCDTVVVASGVHPDAPLAAEIAALGVAVATVGNAHTLGKAIEAIRAGCELGLTL
jgi:NADH dehydrogenase FAD-containing subunit